MIPANASRPSTASPEARLANSPKNRSEADRPVIMGEIAKGSGLPPSASQAFEDNPALEAALERLLRGIRQSRGGPGDGSAR
jgi:hypothetical protein